MGHEAVVAEARHRLNVTARAEVAGGWEGSPLGVLGAAPERFGPRVDDLVRLDPPNVEVSDGMLRSDVVFTDWYGNVELAANPQSVAPVRRTPIPTALRLPHLSEATPHGICASAYE